MQNKTNKFAIYSIICSVVSIFIFWWLSLAGIGYGIKALRDIKANNEKGKILAILGIIIGVCGTIIYYVSITGIFE